MAGQEENSDDKPRPSALKHVLSGLCRLYLACSSIAAPMLWMFQCSKIRESNHKVTDLSGTWQVSGNLPYREILTEEQVANIEKVDVNTIRAWAIEGRFSPHPATYESTQKRLLFPINYKLRKPTP